MIEEMVSRLINDISTVIDDLEAIKATRDDDELRFTNPFIDEDLQKLEDAFRIANILDHGAPIDVTPPDM